jgi:hypothetical protein
MQMKSFSDLSDNKAGTEDNDASATVTEATLCVVCRDSERQPIALVQCGHSVMCSQCAHTIFENGQLTLSNVPIIHNSAAYVVFL